MQKTGRQPKTGLRDKEFRNLDAPPIVASVAHVAEGASGRDLEGQLGSAGGSRPAKFVSHVTLFPFGGARTELVQFKLVVNTTH
jgi:hypothetical protein